MLTKLDCSLRFAGDFDWPRCLGFYRSRALDGVERLGRKEREGQEGRQPQEGQSVYQRIIALPAGWAVYQVQHEEFSQSLQLQASLQHVQDIEPLKAAVTRQFDLDADLSQVEAQLKLGALGAGWIDGVRIPGIISPFEAGVRAVLGQQVSVTAARNLVQQVVDELASAIDVEAQTWRLFPTPAQIAQSELIFLKVPGARREALRRLAGYCAEHGDANPDDWLALKGIGPWTVNYVKLRAGHCRDIFLDSDLGVKNALKQQKLSLSAVQVSPWGSYATFQLWHRL
ncbi:DNA-3-methyladenine glycosylase 2 [Aliagarivorans taiwanensis]|uniref:DNA-3-methyladenine glycosylase 2 n=1 Tax=Aliagarivorans taiwanensis TaxID=561966 RepID=UPI00040D8C86|nr:AlkA N-terminal domain-containing protein [Aliagarivorans taiwanensis]